MNKRKYILFLLVLAVAIGSILTGCGKEEKKIEVINISQAEELYRI